MDFAEAQVVGIFIRTFFYGIYLLIVVHCLRWILFEDEGWRLRPKVNRLKLAVIVLVFLFTTCTLGIWSFVTLATLRDIQRPPAGVDMYILATTTLDNVTTLMIDGILILRCWVVSKKSWLTICFPLVLWLANICLSVTYTYMNQTSTHVKYSAFLAGFYSCNMAINLYATSAIIYQILRVVRLRPGGSHSGSDLYEICRILVECGLPYLFTTLFYLVIIAIKTKPYLFPICCALNSTMNAVTSNLLVIRVGLHRTDGKRNDEPISASNLQLSVVTPERDRLEEHAHHGLDNSEKGVQEAVGENLA